MLSDLTPPTADEYAAFYAGYVATVTARDVAQVLAMQAQQLRETCVHLTDEQALFRYAPDKWSIKQVIRHLSDAERVFSYRALRISRGDATPLPGFDENSYAAESRAEALRLTTLLDEFDAVRAATRALYETLTPEQAARRGTASEKTITVRALVYITAGHVAHHLNILQERYGLVVTEAGAAG